MLEGQLTIQVEPLKPPSTVFRVKLSSDKLETTKEVAKTFLNIEVEIENVEPAKVVKPRKRKVVHNSPKLFPRDLC